MDKKHFYKMTKKDLAFEALLDEFLPAPLGWIHWGLGTLRTAEGKGKIDGFYVRGTRGGSGGGSLKEFFRDYSVQEANKFLFVRLFRGHILLVGRRGKGGKGVDRCSNDDVINIHLSIPDKE
jgi:hypothetical protein